MAPAPQEAPTDRNVVKTVSMKGSLVDAVERRAQEERHGVFSRVVVAAIVAYLATPVNSEERVA
jgi:hypothetical protein